MTVKELIEKLQTFDPDQPVFVHDMGDLDDIREVRPAVQVLYDGYEIFLESTMAMKDGKEIQVQIPKQVSKFKRIQGIEITS